MKSCFNCGKGTFGEARLNDDLNIDPLLPFRPVCDDCGPHYTIIKELSSIKNEKFIDKKEELK